MKRLVRYLFLLPKALFLFVAVMMMQSGLAAVRSIKSYLLFMAAVIAISLLGGYHLSHMTHRINDFSLQRTDRLIAIEENLDDAAIGLGRQIQEWKDMLLRAGNAELYSVHRQAFIDDSVAVQKSLLRAKAAMHSIGMNESEVDRLSAEHKALLAKYVAAQTRLNPQRTDSFRVVDREVLGMDRDLQRHIAAVKDDVELLARRQLGGTDRAGDRQYVLLGFLATASLLSMALIGFAFASRFHDYEAGAKGHSYS